MKFVLWQRLVLSFVRDFSFQKFFRNRHRRKLVLLSVDKTGLKSADFQNIYIRTGFSIFLNNSFGRDG